MTKLESILLSTIVLIVVSAVYYTFFLMHIFYSIKR